MKLFLKIFSAAFYFALLIYISGCSNNKNNKSFKESDSVKNLIDTYVKPEIIDAQKLRGLINDRKGKTLFINVWATWSEPCVREIPEINKLYNEYSEKGIDFLSISVDLTSKIDSVVLPFIKKHDINFPVYVVEEKSGSEVMKILDPRWSGGIPASFIFNKDGRRMIFVLGYEGFDNLSKGIDSVSVL